MRPDPAAPYDLRQLEYGEHLILWSFRAMVTGRWGCPVMRREYQQACGGRADEASQAVQAFAEEVDRHSRRQLAIGAPGILGITRDEQQLLAVYTAAQLHDEPRFNAHMCWLLGRPGAPRLYRLAQQTAEALAEQGHRLAMRLSPFAA